MMEDDRTSREPVPSSAVTLPTAGSADPGPDDKKMSISEPPVVPGSAPLSAHGGAAPIPPGDSAFVPTRKLYLAFASICFMSLTVALDATTLSVALPTMTTKLGGTALQAFWSGTSFLLASTVVQPPIAAVSSIFGRKLILYLCLTFFSAGSLMSALANDFGLIIAGRTVQGVGGGGILALSEIVLTDLLPLAERPPYFAIVSVCWAVGTVAGPLVGGAFAEYASWRWIFYINLPMAGVSVVGITFYLDLTPIPGDLWPKLRRIDYTGTFLFTASLTAFLFGVTTGGVMYEWSSFRCLLPLILGPFGLVLFFIWEVKFAEEPLVHHAMFANRDMYITFTVTMFHGMVIWSMLYFEVLYYQAVLLYSALGSGLGALPMSALCAPAAMVVGIVASKWPHYRWAMWSGWGLLTLGSGLLILLRPGTTIAQWIFINVPFAIGGGFLFPTIGLSVQAATPPLYNGPAVGFMSFMRCLGESMGVGVSGVIFQNSFRSKLERYPALAPHAGEWSADATTVISVIKAMASGRNKTDLIQAYSDGLGMVWISMVAFSAFSGLISLFLKGYPLNQEHVTDQGLVADARPVSPERGLEERAEEKESGREGH